MVVLNICLHSASITVFGNPNTEMLRLGNFFGSTSASSVDKVHADGLKSIVCCHIVGHNY